MLACAVAAAAPPAAGARSIAGKVKPPAAGSLYWGGYRTNVPYSRSAVKGLEGDAGRRPAIVMWFQEWAGKPAFPAADAAWLRRRGEVPMITWEAWKPPRVQHADVVNQPAFRLRRIANGAWDGFLRTYARQIRAYGGPVMIRPFHEMDGDWYPWAGTVNGNNAAAFVAAWRHVHEVFRRAGARNVTWVWSVNSKSIPATSANSIARYWPGARYVDWVGVSCFNFAGTLPLTDPWQSFGQVCGSRLSALPRYGKPIAITELGSVETGGDKAAWIGDAFGQMLNGQPPVRAFIWYDRFDGGGQEFQIASSPAARAAFRGVVADPHVRSAPAALRSG